MGYPLRSVAAIFLGGAVGALARATTLELLPADAGAWPWATFLTNVAGSLLLGWFVIRLPPRSSRRPLLTAGFCGALTTFATLQLELLQMVDDRRYALAAAYVLVSVSAAWGGMALAMRLARREERAA